MRASFEAALLLGWVDEEELEVALEVEEPGGGDGTLELVFEADDELTAGVGAVLELKVVLPAPLLTPTLHNVKIEVSN